MNNLNTQNKAQITKEVFPYMEMLFKSYPNISVVHRLESVESTHFFLLKPLDTLDDAMYEVIENITSKWQNRNTYGDICVLPASERHIRRTKDLITVGEYTAKDFPSTPLTIINNNVADLSARLNRKQKNLSFYIAGISSAAIVVLLLSSFLFNSETNPNIKQNIGETPIDTVLDAPKIDEKIFAELENLKETFSETEGKLKTANEEIIEKDKEIKLLKRRNNNFASGSSISKDDIKNGMKLSSNSSNITISNVNTSGRYTINFDYAMPQKGTKKGVIRLDFNLVELEGLGAGRISVEKNDDIEKIIFQIISDGDITVFKE